MMRNGLVVAYVSLLYLTGCQPAGPAMLSEADVAAIESSSQGWLEAARAADWAALAAHYTEDAVFMPPNGPAVQGRAAIQEWFEAFPPVTAMDFQLVEIDGLGDLAYVYGKFTLTIAPEGMDAMDDVGKFIEIRQRQSDGSWLLLRDIFNSDLPPPGQP